MTAKDIILIYGTILNLICQITLGENINSNSPSVFPTSKLFSWPTPAIIESHPCDDSHNYIYNGEVETRHLNGLKVIYFEDWKIVTANRDGSKENSISYILYTCEMPSQDTLRTLGYQDVQYLVQIPLKNVAFTQTYYSHALELLSLRIASTVIASPFSHNTSPCLRQLYNYGYINEVYNTDPHIFEEELTQSNIDATFATKEQVQDDIFAGIPVPDSWYNSTALQSSESYLKFFSVFFNVESIANELITTQRNNYACSSKVAKRASTISSRVLRVLWCDYAGKYAVHRHSADPHIDEDVQYIENIWKCYTCPGKECSLVQDAGGTFLDYTNYGPATIFINNTYFLDSTLFMEMAQAADVWLTYGDVYSDFNHTLSQLINEEKQSVIDSTLLWLPLVTIPAVKNMKLYDFKLKGSYVSLEEMPLEPDSVLQDIASVLGKTTHTRIWIRNIFRETMTVSKRQCDGNPWLAPPLQASECYYVDWPSSPTPAPTSHHSVNIFEVATETNTVRGMVVKLSMLLGGIGACGLILSLIYTLITSRRNSNKLHSGSRGMLEVTPYRRSSGGSRSHTRKKRSGGIKYSLASEDSRHGGELESSILGSGVASSSLMLSASEDKSSLSSSVTQSLPETPLMQSPSVVSSVISHKDKEKKSKKKAWIFSADVNA